MAAIALSTLAFGREHLSLATSPFGKGGRAARPSTPKGSASAEGGAKINGRGWLRTLALGSSTASYAIELACDAEGAIVAAQGTLRAEIATMIEAREARRATLVLESGVALVISIVSGSSSELAFEVTGDLSPLTGERH